VNPVTWLRHKLLLPRAIEHDDRAAEAIRHGERALKQIREEGKQVKREADYLRQQRATNHWSERVYTAWRGRAI
jgi:hypothetical protein